MNILIACEESQRVCAAFREKGHNAFSCDIIECSGGHPEWHIMQDVIPLLNGHCHFETTDGKQHFIDGKWDMIIAHPPCTFLTVAANKLYNVEKYGEKAIQIVYGFMVCHILFQQILLILSAYIQKEKVAVIQDLHGL